MVDKAVLAKKVAAIRDAVSRIQDVLPPTAEAFVADRTAREIVTLNLFLYRIIDFRRVFTMARDEVGDLGPFCRELSARVGAD